MAQQGGEVTQNLHKGSRFSCIIKIIREPGAVFQIWNRIQNPQFLPSFLFGSCFVQKCIFWNIPQTCIPKRTAPNSCTPTDKPLHIPTTHPITFSLTQINAKSLMHPNTHATYCTQPHAQQRAPPNTFQRTGAP